MSRRSAITLSIVALLCSGCEETRLLTTDTTNSATSAPDISNAYQSSDTASRASQNDSFSLDTVDVAADTQSPPIATNGYGHTAPPLTPTPSVLLPDQWVSHAVQDLMPFWMQPTALGATNGNYPTYRTMTGATTNQTERRPRMIGRQVFTYCAAFHITGDTAYLAPAKAGVDWLLQHAWDSTLGGWHGLLDAQGNALGNEPRTAQDAAYVALGLSAWFYITRDAEAEQGLLNTRDVLMDGVLWDAAAGRIKDAVSANHLSDIDVENDGGAELVAQLDAINAFLFLSQRVLTEPTRRTQFGQDLETLGDVLVQDFLSDGVFWGVHNQQGDYSGRHVDFGHNLKAYWMLLQIDKRLPSSPYRDLLDTHLTSQLSRAYDGLRGRWGKRPTGANTTELGSDWWIWAECDQLAATLNLTGGTYDDWLTLTASHWADFVDTTRTARELIPTIDADGAWVYPWPDSDTAKANQWKNGYHGLEHALVMYLHGHWRSNSVAALYFAPVRNADTFIATPYVWHGEETNRTVGEAITLEGQTHTLVTVYFSELF